MSSITQKITIAAVALAALGFAAGRAQASSFTFNYCPGDASCQADLQEASITFATDESTALDLNDYIVTLRFVGTKTDTFIDSVDFTAGLDVASLPTLLSAPTGTSLLDWTTRFDKINASAASNCVASGSNQKFVCATSTTGVGPDLNGINEWVFAVDFAGTGLVSETSKIDLRAHFVDANGDNSKGGAMMSPSGYVSTTTTGQTTTTNQTVPEPVTLSLLGVGLAAASRRLRRSKQD